MTTFAEIAARLGRHDDRVVVELHDASLRDASLLRTLFQYPGHDFHAQTRHITTDLYNELLRAGTLTIPIQESDGVIIDGRVYPVVFVGATTGSSNHGEMSKMLYLRDQVQCARILMHLHLRNPDMFQQEGEDARRLLMSALHLMSTPAQIKRFYDVINKGALSGQADWPSISFWHDDLQAEKPNGWRNKQDTFQMLAHLTLDAVMRGFITVDDLLDSHKDFLSLIVPLLKSVGFPAYESSGSWEENVAVRTSVMSVEVAMLSLMHDFSDRKEGEFLLRNCEKAVIGELFDMGVRMVAQRLPFESPDYPVDSIQYRQADAALTYVLMYDLPAMIAGRKLDVGEDRQKLNRQQIETLVLESLATLDDAETGGMIRYHGDSYQRVNFHTHEVQWVVNSIKRFLVDHAVDGVIDYEQKQRLRGRLTPLGREAAWVHPLGQLSAWASGRAIESNDKRYRHLAEGYLLRLLTQITTKDDRTTMLGGDGYYVVGRILDMRLPECYVTYRHNDLMRIVPSPHTPLNWAAACAKEAIGLYVQS